MTKKKDKGSNTQMTELSEDETSTNMTSVASRTALGATASGPQIKVSGTVAPGGAVAPGVAVAPGGAVVPGGAVAVASTIPGSPEVGYPAKTSTSPYPYKNQKKKKEKKLREVDVGDGHIVYANSCWGMFLLIIVKFRRILNMVLAVIWLINGCCLLAIGHETLRIQLTPNITWELANAPVAEEFDRYSFSSSNEMCNELARMALMEDHLPFDAMPLLMLACLYVAEPHASGPGGDAMIIYGDKRECDQINGLGFNRDDLTEILYKRMKDDPFAHFQGTSSVRYPGEIIAMAQVISKISEQIFNPAEHKEIIEKLKIARIVFENEFFDENLHFAVSHRLSEAIRKAPTAMLGITAGNHFMFDEEFRVRSEGELYPMPQEALKKYNPLFFINIDMSHIEHELPLYYQDLLDRALAFQHHEEKEIRQTFFAKETELLTRALKHSSGFKAKLNNGMTVCAPIPLRDKIQDPLVATMLKKYKKSEIKTRHADESHPLSMIGTFFYQKILELFHEMKQRFEEVEEKRSQDEKKLQNKMSDVYMENWEEEKEHTHRMYAVGNSFVLVDHKKRKGLALTATLGSPFGSLISDGGDVIMNNLNMNMLRYVNNSGDLNFLQEAIIVMDGAQPHTVYAGVPGLPLESRGIPRQMTALVLSVFHGAPLEMALTVPLVWTDGYQILLKGKFPYESKLRFQEKMNNLKNESNFPIMTDSDFLVDEAAAVHEKKAISMAMEQRGVGKVMPNGL